MLFANLSIIISHDLYTVIIEFFIVHQRKSKNNESIGLFISQFSRRFQKAIENGVLVKDFDFQILCDIATKLHRSYSNGIADIKILCSGTNTQGQENCQSG